MPNVSVCIPVYGVEKFIERCARSLFEQTMTEGIEFIFVNDCTKDKSMEILEHVLKEYPHRIPQVKIIHHKKNGGLVAARKTGLANATGDYVIHCDSDDWVDPEMYKTLYTLCVKNNADFAYCAFVIDNDSGKKKMYPVAVCQNVSEAIKLSWLQVGLYTKMFRRNIAVADDIFVPDHLCYGEDLLRVTQTILKCKTVVACPKAFYHYYRGNKDSYTSTFNLKSALQWIEVVDFLKSHFPGQLSLERWQGEILFHITIRRIMNRTDYAKLWPCEKKAILGAAELHPIKKAVIASSYFAYNLTSCVCKFLLNLLK